MSKTLRDIRKLLERRSKTRRPWVGLVGTADGVIEVPGRPMFWYVRPKGTDLPIPVRGGGAPKIAGTEVLVGRDPVRRNIVRILGLGDSVGGAASESQATESHAGSHGPAGSDPVYVSSWQIIDALVYPTTGMTVRVNAGRAIVQGYITPIAATTVNLAGHVPVSGARWALIRADRYGAVDVVDGEAVDSLADLTLGMIPDADEDHAPLAAARLYAGQTALSKLVASPDVLDLRFAPASPAGSRIHHHDDRYYTETELNTPGAGGEVHWDNITDKPPMEVTLFLHEEDADVAGYERLLEHPSDDPENIDSAVLAEVDTEYVIDEYITYPTTGWGRTFIQGGAWQFMTWVRVDSAVGDTRLVIRVYKRDQGGNETELFNVTSDEINNTSVEEVDIETVQPDIFLDETDRLVVKYLGKTTSVSDRTIYLYYEGSVNYSHVHLPGAGISGGGGAVDFVDLADVPNSYAGAGGYAVKVNATADGLEFVDETIPEAFTDLSDTPSDYTDQAGKVLEVNATEDGLEFGDVGWDDVADKPETFNRFYPKEEVLQLEPSIFESNISVNLPTADEEVFISSHESLPEIGLGVSRIPTGTWTFQAIVSGQTTVSGALSLIVKVNKTDAAGTPTLLFSVEEQIPGTAPSDAVLNFTSAQNEYALDPTDHLRVYYYAKSTQGGSDNLTLELDYLSNGGNDTYIEIPQTNILATGAHNLASLADVFIDGIADGQSIRFDSTPGIFVPYDPAGGVTVEETDGAPSIAADKIVFGKSTVADLGSGDARVKGLFVNVSATDLTDSAGGGSGPRNTGTYTFRPQDNSNLWPTDAVALMLFFHAVWATASSTSIASLRQTSGGTNGGQVRALVSGVAYSIHAVALLDGNGYFYLNVAGANANNVTLRIIGYWH